MISAEQRDATEHHEQGEEWRAVHRRRFGPRQEGSRPVNQIAECSRGGQNLSSETTSDSYRLEVMMLSSCDNLIAHRYDKYGGYLDLGSCWTIMRNVSNSPN